MKYTGEVAMDDYGITHQQEVTERLRANLVAQHGEGQLNTSVSTDNVRLLKYTFVTNSDETIVPGHARLAEADLGEADLQIAGNGEVEELDDAGEGDDAGDGEDAGSADADDADTGDGEDGKGE